MDLGLQGRVALVTGAAGGIGRACVELLQAEGCDVVATDIQAGGLGELEEKAGDRLVTVVADAADAEGSTVPVTRAVEAFGGLDVLILAAGVFGKARGGIFAGEEGASEIAPDEWDLTQAVNLRGPFLTAQAAIPVMARSGWGRIVAIASVSGQMGGFRAGADYAASKAGLAGMVRALAPTAGPSGITVNTLNPGMILTPMLTDNVGGGYSASVAERSAIGRLGTAEEVAAMALMLVSDAAGFVTGAHLDVNGGFYFS
jgi:3-oxoacyl-[acyl-carrier protein] reductase